MSEHHCFRPDKYQSCPDINALLSSQHQHLGLGYWHVFSDVTQAPLLKKKHCSLVYVLSTAFRSGSSWCQFLKMKVNPNQCSLNNVHKPWIITDGHIVCAHCTCNAGYLKVTIFCGYQSLRIGTKTFVHANKSFTSF